MRRALAVVVLVLAAGCTSAQQTPTATTTTSTPPSPSPIFPASTPGPEAPTPTPTAPSPSTPPAPSAPTPTTPPTPAPTPSSPAPPRPTPSTPPAPAPAPPRPPPESVRFVEGADAGPSRLGKYVASYSLSPDGAVVRAEVRGVPEATLVIGSLFRVRDDDGVARIANVTAPRVASAYVTEDRIDLLRQDGTVAAALDLLSASPAAEVALSPGDVLDGRLTLTLASGAGADNALSETALTLAVKTP